MTLVAPAAAFTNRFVEDLPVATYWTVEKRCSEKGLSTRLKPPQPQPSGGALPRFAISRLPFLVLSKHDGRTALPMWKSRQCLFSFASTEARIAAGASLVWLLRCRW